jgi:hypothetical protein
MPRGGPISDCKAEFQAEDLARILALTNSPECFTLQYKVMSQDLNRALGDIKSIRQQMARTTEFRGYGPATLAATAVLAVVAAAAQAAFVRNPVAQVGTYLGIWISTAVLSFALAGTQMYARSRRIHSVLSDEMIWMAVEQFLPSLSAGVLTTIVLSRYAPAALWMLPGIWQLVFSLGVFSSCRFLPRPMLAAGVWYLATALVCFSLGDGRALSPWAMGIPFAAGQSIVSAVLLFASNEQDGNES